METAIASQPGSRGDYADGDILFNNRTGMEPFSNGFGNDLTIPCNPNIPNAANEMFLDDFHQGDYPTGSFQPGFLPNTIAPQATYSGGNPSQAFNRFHQNNMNFTQQTTPQLLQNIQIGSNTMDFYLADGFSMPSSNNIGLGGQDPNQDTENEGGELHAPVNAKRGRRNRKKVLSEADQATKRQRFLARNRQSATKCRNRKKEWTQNLDEKAEHVAHTQQSLIFQLKEVEEEKRSLQRQITEHASCGNPIIQEYLIAQAAATADPTPRPQYNMMKMASQESERILQGGVSPSLHMWPFHLDMRIVTSVLGSQVSFLGPSELSY